MRRISFFALCAGLMLCVGCREASVAEAERAERADALFAEALAAESRGDSLAAGALYEQVLAKDQSKALAHLNLAIVQHDFQKQYIDAMYHYRQYLTLQPKSEKRVMVEERLAAARTALASQLASEMVAAEAQRLLAEKQELEGQLSERGRELSEAHRAVDGKEKEVLELKRELTQLRNLVETMKAAEASAAERSRENVAAARTAAEEMRAPVEEEDTTAMIAAARADAEKMLSLPDGGQTAVNEKTRQAVEGVEAEVPLSPTAVSGKRYLVRPGDTLSKLALEAYGRKAEWAKIRDANRSTVNPDGRLKAGDVILIP